MRNLLRLVTLGFLLAASAVSVADQKLGVVDMEKAVMDTTKAKSMSEQFVKDFTQDDAKAKKIEADMKALNDKRIKGGASLPKSEQDALFKQMQSKNQERGEIIKKIKQAEQERLQQLHAAVDPKIKDVMKDVAESGGYSMIIDKKAAPYFNPSDDVTQQTTEKLNQALK